MGARWNAGTVDSTRGHHFGSFYTDTQLSAARILEISNAVRAVGVTGAKGEALTYTRAGTRHCSTHPTTDVTVTAQPADLPCIQQGGMLVENSRTNLLLRSEAIENAAWNRVNGGPGPPAAPTVSGNYALGPDTLLRADRLIVPACPGLDSYSAVEQLYTSSVAAHSVSVFLKGTSGSGTIGLYLWDFGAGSKAVSCSYNATTWTRCTVTTIPLGVTQKIGIGCINYAAYGGSDTGAADVLVFGAQAELGANASSYMRTDGATATRSADGAAYFTFASGPIASIASTVGLREGFVTNARVGNGSDGVAQYLDAYLSSNRWMATEQSDGVTYKASGSMIAAGTANLSADNRFATWIVPAVSINGQVNGGATFTNSVGIPNAPTLSRFYLNSTFATHAPDGVFSKVCADPSPTRCR
jgi:hypothetical protein